METLLSLVERMESLGEREAIWWDNGYRGTCWSYATLVSRIRITRERLAPPPDTGELETPRHIILWADASPEWVACYWAVVASGIRAVPLDPATHVERVERIANQVRAELVLIRDRDSRERLETAGFRCADPSQLTRAEELPSSTVVSPAQATVHADTVAQILFSSGTTGEPHGVIHRHRHLIATLAPVAKEISRYKQWMRPFQPIRIMNTLPLSHVFGQLMGLFVPPLVGGAVVLSSEQHPRRLVQTIQRRRVSVLSAVPRLADTLHLELEPSLRAPRTFPTGLRGVATRWWHYRDVHRKLGFKFWTLVVGGAELGQETELFFKQVGLAVIQGYGMTEASALITANHPLRTQAGSIGKPVPGQQVRLAEDGEILVRGESVSHETFDPNAAGGISSSLPSNEAQETGSAKQSSEWLATGDIGELQADGSIVFRGRKKDMIVGADGLNVFPSDLEPVLSAIEGVRDALVVKKSLASGDIPYAVLRLDEGISPGPIIQQANRRLESHQRIKGHALWPDSDFPRTSTGKIKRHLVREWVETSETPSSMEKALTPHEIAESFFLERYGIEHVFRSPELVLDEVGLGSLDRVELLVALERTTQRSLGSDSMAAITTARELSDWIDSIEEPTSTGPAGLVTDRAPGVSLSRKAHVPSGLPAEKQDQAAVISNSQPRRQLARAVGYSNRWPARLVRASIRDIFTRPLVRYFLQPVIDPPPPEIDPPFIIAANHASHLDTPALLGILPSHWRHRLVPAMSPMHFAHYFLGDPSLFRRFRAGLRYWAAVTIFNAYPLFSSSETLEDVLNYLGRRAERGDCPLIFPEGVRNPEGRLQKLQAGVGLMAQSLELPVVPVYMKGTAESLPPGRRWPKRVPLKIRWGKPVYPGHGETAAAFTARIADQLSFLEQR